MSTRSTIAVQHDNGSISQIYCHSDGYLSYNGELLRDHWADVAKLEQLVALGDISVLGEVVGEQHPFEAPGGWGSSAYKEHYEKYGKMCRAYMRDRNETGCEARVLKDRADYDANGQEEEYNYLFADGKWTVKCSYSFGGQRVDLTEAFAIEQKERDAEHEEEEA
jgi:hypothetical protein